MHPKEPASAKIQKIILWIGAGTFLSIITGAVLFSWKTSAYTAEIKYEIENLRSDITKNQLDFDKCRTITDDKIKEIRIDLNNINQIVAVHTKRPIVRN